MKGIGLFVAVAFCTCLALFAEDITFVPLPCTTAKAVLIQHAFESLGAGQQGILAGIRVGVSRDGKGPLLNISVPGNAGVLEIRSAIQQAKIQKGTGIGADEIFGEFAETAMRDEGPASRLSISYGIEPGADRKAICIGSLLTQKFTFVPYELATSHLQPAFAKSDFPFAFSTAVLNDQTITILVIDYERNKILERLTLPATCTAPPSFFIDSRDAIAVIAGFDRSYLIVIDLCECSPKLGNAIAPAPPANMDASEDVLGKVAKLWRINDWEDAIDVFQTKMLTLQPANVQAGFGKALDALKRGDFDGASKTLTQEKVIENANGDGKLVLRALLYKIDSLEREWFLAERLLQASPNENALLLLRNVKSAINANNLSEANALIERATGWLSQTPTLQHHFLQMAVIVRGRVNNSERAKAR